MAELRRTLAEPQGFISNTFRHFDWPFLVADFLAVAVGLGLARLAFNLLAGQAFYTPVTAGLGGACLAVLYFWFRGHYRRRRTSGQWLKDVVFVVVILAAFESLAFTTTLFLPSWAAVGAIILVVRFTVRRQLKRRDTWRRPAVVLGDPELAKGIAASLTRDEDLGLYVTDVLEVAEQRSAEVEQDPLAELSLRFRDHVILIATPTQNATVDRLAPTLTAAWPMVAIALPPLPGAAWSPEGAGRCPLLWAENPLAQWQSQIAKRAVDIAGSLCGLLLFSPVFLAMWINGTASGLPVVFGHRRIGRNGVPFTCYKFRTMVVDADKVLEELLARDPAARAEWEASYKLKNDPRVTKLGAILRRTSLDELPQFWNVLKGDMSLVGPRPIVENELRYYGDDLQEYLSVKPGLTGIWQVSGRSDTSYDYRVDRDRWYVRHWSFWHDVAIIARTVGVLLTRKGAY